MKPASAMRRSSVSRVPTSPPRPQLLVSETGDRGLGEGLLAVVVARDAKHPDQRGQRQTLHDERRDDHREGEEDDQVALREMWTYSDGDRTVKACWRPDDAGPAGRWP